MTIDIDFVVEEVAADGKVTRKTLKAETLRRWIEIMVSGGQGPEYVDDKVNDAFGEFCEHHEEMVVAREGSEEDSDLLLRWMHAELDGQKLEEDQLLFEHALILAGGIETSAQDYGAFLRRLLVDAAAPLQIGALLGTSPVCTFPDGNCNASRLTAIPEAWHYSLGH